MNIYDPKILCEVFAIYFKNPFGFRKVQDLSEDYQIISEDRVPKFFSKLTQCYPDYLLFVK